MDTFDAMRAFVRVYEAGSFSLAAKGLNVGQPSVSKVVAQLENHLGVKLLLRSTHGLTPTEAGETFYAHAVRVLDAADEAMLSVTQAGQALTGRLRVSGTITFMRQYIIPALPAFYTRHPKVDMEMLLDDRNVGLIEEGVDIALRMGRLASSGLTARKIGQCRRIVVGTADYFEIHGAPQTPEDLLDHPSVILSLGEGGEQVGFCRGGRTRNITLRPRLRVSATEGVRAAVLAGVGLAVATEWIFEDELTSGRVREALIDWSLPSLDLWAVLPAGRQASPKARAFLTFVEEQLRKTRFSVHS